MVCTAVMFIYCKKKLPKAYDEKNQAFLYVYNILSLLFIPLKMFLNVERL